MNKKVWLAAALARIDSMSRDEFLSALQGCGALDTNYIENSGTESEKITFVINNQVVDPITRHTSQVALLQIDEGCLSFASLTAPQEALYHSLAA